MEQETPEQASMKIVERLHKEETKKSAVEKARASDATVADESAEAK
jgi:hypothetical protein